jgi:amino acid transporter
MPIIEHTLPPETGASGQPKPQSPLEFLRWLIFGSPIASAHTEGTLVRKLIALPVFCSDAISSVAYGGQQILLALCAAGLWLPEFHSRYSAYTMQISGAILILLIVVAASYWQTIFTYPNGGGSYTVSRSNLGTHAGLVAAAALLIDYVLTCAVSVASGLQNLESVPLFAGLHIERHIVLYCVAVIAFIVLANLRGLKESGYLFALPTYIFIAMCYLMIILGIAGPYIGWHFHPEFVNQVVPPMAAGTKLGLKAFGIAVLLRAFANGCSAMTGIEATSNGIPSFQEPKSKNAAIVLVWMAVLLGSIFMGVSWLAVKFHVVYWEHGGITSPAVIDQLSGMVFGKDGPWMWAYVITQVFTALVLIVAAQTSFAGFPRLASMLAQDAFLPRQLMNLGDKLAFNNGIMVLGLFASFFIIAEHGSVDLLIPFFAIGVFMAFTMSQSGMVRHWFVDKGPNWQRKAAINGLGAVASFIVVIDIACEKFFDGAWFVFVVMAVLLVMFKSVHKHYATIAKQLSPINFDHPACEIKNKVLVLVNGVHAGSLNALEYARSISSDCEAVYVASDPDRTKIMKEAWEKFVPDIPLVIIDSPYRSLLHPLMRYLDEVHAEQPNQTITVIIGEFVPTNWWEHMLHGDTGLFLKLALLGRKDVVVTNVRYWLCDHALAAHKTEQKPS